MADFLLHVPAASRNASDWWLSYWVTHSETSHHSHNHTQHNDSALYDVIVSSHQLDRYMYAVKILHRRILSLISK